VDTKVRKQIIDRDAGKWTPPPNPSTHEVGLSLGVVRFRKVIGFKMNPLGDIHNVTHFLKIWHPSSSDSLASFIKVQIFYHSLSKGKQSIIPHKRANNLSSLFKGQIIYHPS
jgi:hypothetical protein